MTKEKVIRKFLVDEMGKIQFWGLND